MPGIRRELRFLLNNELISLSSIKSDDTLLDFLRLERSLRGTKEGCAEGDCGACTVLIGRLVDAELRYESVNACIRLMGSLDATHVVTIEHVRRSGPNLHPVQQAMVSFGGSQCGFCTPGFVMSLYALWMHTPNPTTEMIERSLQGNLCRCTGYEAIIRSALAMSNFGEPSADPLVQERSQIVQQLRDLQDGVRIEINNPKDHGTVDCLIVPQSLDDLGDVLADTPGATIVAGSTDVGLWVTKGMRDISPTVFIGHLTDLKSVTVSGGELIVGAGTTYSELYEKIGDHIPALRTLLDKIGGAQVRNMGTVGGNIANGSPIGDIAPALIALGAKLILRKRSERRSLALEDFFVAYGKQAREPTEFVESISIPLPATDQRFSIYKVSKRRHEDITTVLGAFCLTISGDRVAALRIAYGGMAGTPKRARHVEEALIGQLWTEQNIERAMLAYREDFTPLTDMRGTSAYRAIVAENLLRRFFNETDQNPFAAPCVREAS